MVFPLSSLELRLVGLLANQSMTPDLLQSLRDVMVEMYATGQLSKSAMTALLSHIERRCGHDPALLELHEETCALARAAESVRDRYHH